MAISDIEESNLDHFGDEEEVLNLEDYEPVPLDTKYREQMRQIFPQKIELPISTLTVMIDRQINLRPEFQRRDRWDRKMQSRFIESIIMNVPVPPVFLGEDEYGKYVVLDGRQRLTAVNDYLRNGYPLRGLEVWTELNGKTFYELEKTELGVTITRRFIPAILLLRESSGAVKYDVFDRLNTGGVHANKMEIRNAVYRGGFTDLIRKMSETDAFRRLWDIPFDEAKREKNNTYATMADLELVLRFFALRDPSPMVGRYSSYLSYYMDERNRKYAAQPDAQEQDQRQFLWATTNALKIFDGHAFISKNFNKSVPLADAILIALKDIDPSRVTDDKISKVRASVSALMQDEEFVKAITSGTNGKGAIMTRVHKAVEVIDQVFA